MALLGSAYSRMGQGCAFFPVRQLGIRFHSSWATSVGTSYMLLVWYLNHQVLCGAEGLGLPITVAGFSFLLPIFFFSIVEHLEGLLKALDFP